jgi:hypothetical protein
MQTMEKNWSKTMMILLIVALTFLILFDTGVIIADSGTGSLSKQDFVVKSYSFLKWVQGGLALTILISYMILFIFFEILIKEDKEQFGSL